MKKIKNKIKRITFVKNEDVYDLTIENNHNFFANKLLVHNCFEISKIPMLYGLDGKIDKEKLKDIEEIKSVPINTNQDLSKIKYEDVYDYIKTNSHKLGVQGCNLTEINAEKCTTKDKFYNACKSASIIGTLQAGWTNFPYLGEVTEQIFRKEALLGVSITGWMNNPKLFNEQLLTEGAEIVKSTNKEVAALIGINQAARTTTVKPSGNAAVVLGTASGIHPEHSTRYFRIMQLNKESDTAKWLEKNMEFLLEESVHSETKSDYVVFVPIENPKEGLYKKDLTAIEHLQRIKLVQENWVRPGTVKELCSYPEISHNVSCTVTVGDNEKEEVIDYIWDNKTSFSAVSFISKFGDKDFNQAPFTSVATMEEIIETYGKGALFASGMIVDGIHYFKGNLWSACESVADKSIPISGTREDVLLKKYWIDRVKKYAKNYFKGDLRLTINCLKDVHLLHKWEVVNRQMKSVDFNEILDKPEFKDIDKYAAQSCSGAACDITKI